MLMKTILAVAAVVGITGVAVAARGWQIYWEWPRMEGDAAVTAILTGAFWFMFGVLMLFAAIWVALKSREAGV